MAAMRAVYSLLLLTSLKRPMRWLGADAEFDFERPHEGLEHVHQHAFAAALDDGAHVAVGQREKHQWLAALDLRRVVDLPHHLVRLVDGVGERQTHVAHL